MMQELVQNLIQKGEDQEIYLSKNKDLEAYKIYLNNITNKVEKYFKYSFNEDPHLFINKTVKTKENFFESSRTWNYGLAFSESVLKIFLIVESSGWASDFKFSLDFSANAILKAQVGIKEKTEESEENKFIKIILKNDAFNNLFEDEGDLLDSLKIRGYINETTIELKNYVDSEKDINNLVDFINIWVSTNENKINEMNDEFEKLYSSSFSESDENNFKLFENDAAIDFLKYKKEEDNGLSEMYLFKAFQNYIDFGSSIQNFGIIISEEIFNYINTFKNLEDRLAIFKKHEDDFELVDINIENEILKLEISIVNNSFEKLSNSSNKILVINDNETYYKTANFITVPLNKLPDLLKFPPGHPHSLKTYVQHPILIDKYIPIEDYEQILIKDKLDEYKYLIQCLGASSIQYEISESLYENQKLCTNSFLNADGSRGKVGFSGGIQEELISDSTSNLEARRLEGQEFNPIGIPFIPDDLVWFEHETSWQRLAKQRLNGNILKHIEVIKVSKSDTFSQIDKRSLEAEIKAIVKGIKLNYSSNEESNVQVDKVKQVSTSVIFKDINELQNFQEISKRNSNVISDVNLFNIFENFVSFHGKLENQGIEIFNFLARYLNIDNAKYQNFADTIDANQLSKNEKEYLNMFLLMKGDGNITEKERVILDTIALTLEISNNQKVLLETKKKLI